MSESNRQRDQIEIIEYQRRHAGLFRDINYQWLEKYFEVEPYDRIVLGDPGKHILKQGGCILMARVGGKIVGTCALLKHTERKYELAKMGVSEEFQGKGIGRQLALAAIERARQLQADTLVLATSKILVSANRLYSKLGFEHTDLSEIGPLPYERESIVMKMAL